MLILALLLQTQLDYSLPEKSRTSAGVFTPKGQLVRTLWSNVERPAGKHTASWDWTDDDGALAPEGSYQLKVLSNRMVYTWEGVVGNTSREKTGPTVHHPLMVMQGMAVAGKTAYFATGYNEGYTAQFRFELADPQAKKMILAKGADFSHVATDGRAVYWGGNDTHAEEGSFVVATDPATDLEVAFQKGQAFKTRYGCTYKSVIGLVKGEKRSEVTGLAVGTHLFVARLGRIDVFDKATGEKLREIPVKARGLAWGDGLWMIAEDGVRKENGPKLEGLVRPLAIAVSSQLVLVADGGSSQQLKAFGLDGKPLWTYGRPGGYTVDPTAADDAFDFTADLWHFPADKPAEGTFLAFQPDGSFWVGDGGCFRSTRFSADRKVLDRIAYVPLSYSCAADPNDPSRVFADWLEYRVEYEKLGWALVRNWRGVLPSGHDDYYRRMRCVTTLKNGRTYALFSRPNQKSVVLELTKEGLRDTGVGLTAMDYLCADGSLGSQTHPHKSGKIEFSKRALEGFDAQGNPQWGPPTVIATAPARDTDPVWRGNTHHLRGGQVTESGAVVSFDETPGPDKGRKGRWHLGAVKVGGSDWLWKASPNTPKNYLGPWPTDGSFPITGVFNAGAAVSVVGPHVFYGYYGEGYNNLQANKWRHYHESGLMVGDFGVVGWHGMPEAYPGMAGNAFSYSIVRQGGRMYLYHCDESHGGGVHRWRMEGEKTIAIQTVDLKGPRPAKPGLAVERFDSPDLDRLTASPTGAYARWTGFNRVTGAPIRVEGPEPKVDAVHIPSQPKPITLLDDLPYDSAIPGKAYGWTRTGDDGLVMTNHLTLGRPVNDLFIKFSKGGSREKKSEMTLTRDLGGKAGPWMLKASVTYQGNYQNHGAEGGQFLEVLDADGRVLVRFYPAQISWPGEQRIFANDAVLLTCDAEALKKLMHVFQPLEIGSKDGQLTLRYADLPPVSLKPLDPAADPRRPKSLRLYFWSAGAGYPRQVGIQELTRQ